MEKSGLQPKLRTFLALLNACGSAGRVEEAYVSQYQTSVSGCLLMNFSLFSIAGLSGYFVSGMFALITNVPFLRNYSAISSGP